MQPVGLVRNAGCVASSFKIPYSSLFFLVSDCARRMVFAALVVRAGNKSVWLLRSSRGVSRRRCCRPQASDADTNLEQIGAQTQRKSRRRTKGQLRQRDTHQFQSTLTHTHRYKMLCQRRLVKIKSDTRGHRNLQMQICISDPLNCRKIKTILPISLFLVYFIGFERKKVISGNNKKMANWDFSSIFLKVLKMCGLLNFFQDFSFFQRQD